MAHSLVSQLRFARSELLRCLDGVSAEDAVRRLEPMNCISWIVGHLANQEHVYWVLWAQRKNLAPELQALVGYGRPASTPPPADMWTAWRIITKAADEFLDGVTAERLQTHLEWNGNPVRESIGTMILRNTYHYWYHLGEAHAIRQLLGHRDLPQFVGDMTEVRHGAEQQADPG